MTDEVSEQKKAKEKTKDAEEFNNMDGIDEDLWQHIEAQLQSAKPIRGNCGWTVLHRAAARGLTEVVGRLLTVCSFLTNEKCNDRTTALHLAARNGHTTTVTQLLAVCPVLICEDDTALHLAAENGHAVVVTQLLAMDPTLAEARTNGGLTALHYAASRGQAAMVTQLLAANPSLVEARTRNGWTALHFAAFRGHTATATQLLAANPALIDVRADDGSTALHVAAGGGHTVIVTQLLALKPALAEATVLHDAAKNGQAATVAQLLAANPALVNEKAYGRTALHWAASKGHATITAQLLAARASTAIKSGDGRTALHEAVWGGHSEIVSQLLAANPALIDTRENNGSSVLRYARDDGIIAQLLAARPALLDPMINDADNETALANAVQLGQEETATRLLTMHPNLIRGASYDLCGWTAFHYAAYFAREKVMSWLLSAVSELDLEQVLRQRSTERYFDVDEDMTALHVAVMRGHRNTIAQLLAVCPSLIDVLKYSDFTIESELDIFNPASAHAVDANGNTLLHSILMRQRSYGKESIERVWKMNPGALFAANWAGKTPFHLAVDTDNDIAIDLFQWSLTFAEISKVCSHYEKSVERFKPLMQLQCEELAVKLLPRVVDIVFEYLGFRTVKQKPRGGNEASTIPR